ncbi:2Fe-2S iron-sulfur cluster binding domain-containing protein [Aromatoleum toluvorans]|uniref:2Fe-2S iron-sulfur cluster binding domain-containing protein n=1 Tax=Aromatoleum toluvorans TaxID=92002 RepID=A0ABX1Q6C7_9RHOO|nr:hybrid-cluster NAD(P)-dependent oxidoreductase [Aromatoleum toluvorans]NMG46074.1 2Fe-2S iron-sulfur cluster binding domain-containing protein [Aromatoleum toluvorans]
MNGPITRDIPLAVPSLWNAEEDDVLICCQVRQETHDVKSFILRPRRPGLVRFLPGQFITLELEIDGETVNRCYTISSPPTRPDTLSITVKRVPGGRVSNWLHDHLSAGMSLRALGPSGEFACALHPAGKYLFLSGGSGITPLMSMSRSFHDLGEDRDVVFVHSARTPADIVFRRELGLLAANQPGFRTAFVCEGRGSEADWASPTGYLDLPLLKRIAPDFAEREVFCCGPAPYMAAVRALLAEGGFDMKRYHEESFSFADTQGEQEGGEGAGSAETGEGDAAGFTVEFTKSGRSVICAPGVKLLDAARAAGLRLPSSCAKGMCGTCKSRLVSGEVDMAHGGGIRQREIDQGFILPCCSTPRSDLVIER